MCRSSTRGPYERYELRSIFSGRTVGTPCKTLRRWRWLAKLPVAMPTKAAECLAKILEGDKDGLGVLSWRDHARAPFPPLSIPLTTRRAQDPLNSFGTLADAGMRNFAISVLFKREALCSRKRAVLVHTGYLENTAKNVVRRLTTIFFPLDSADFHPDGNS